MATLDELLEQQPPEIREQIKQRAAEIRQERSKAINLTMTLTIDAKLFAKAVEHSPDKPQTAAELVNEALSTFVRVKAGKGMRKLGGKCPGLPDIPRRRPDDSTP